ncbi:uncharacterized protein [Elaeis guineensis]|uniref:uncharacterized protein isoform X2 n=1 Tax=Elaeis guineensis var. tenera TaxID=51953 RepID=UPI003C6CD261
MALIDSPSSQNHLDQLADQCETPGEKIIRPWPPFCHMEKYKGTIPSPSRFSFKKIDRSNLISIDHVLLKTAPGNRNLNLAGGVREERERDAMDPFTSFSEELIHGDNMLYWAFSPAPAFDLVATIPEPAIVDPPVVHRSAFRPYARPDNGQIKEAVSSGNGDHRKSIHQRMIEMVRRIPKAKEECKGVEMSRGFKHMMRERQRREKLSQRYADLYSMLSSRSKLLHM